MPELLLELLSEEIPARMQTRAAEDLQTLITNGLVDHGLTYEAVQAHATPRRLVLSVDGLSTRTPDIKDERKGPRIDAPEQAIQGFLKSANVTLAECDVAEDKKGPFYVARIEKPGRMTPQVLGELVPAVILKFPWPKSMRWGTGTLRWVRPLHSILCAFDGKPVAFEVGSIVAGSTTRGHRFMSDGEIGAAGFADYEASLRTAHVMVDAHERAETICSEANALAFAQGLEVVYDQSLVAETAGLVEWPVVLMGKFDTSFLDVPPEVLVTSLKVHQKCFALQDKAGNLANRYLLVSNLVATDGGKKIVEGNNRVIAARLSDAKFFWDQDLRHKLEDRLPELASITFHARLGSQAKRVERIAVLAGEIAGSVGADPEKAQLAARLCKADLVTGMVGEFPELQGLMGRYYALEEGIDDDVADAIRDHYKPQGPSEPVPENKTAQAVALADKIDTLAGFWVIDEKPTGSKDPYALRRAALGVIRIVLEGNLRLGLVDLAQLSCQQLHSHDSEPPDMATWRGRQVDRPAIDLLGFFADRLKIYLRDKGVRHDLIDAVFAIGEEDDLALIVTRVAALADFLDTDDGKNLLAGVKRAANILKIEEKKDGTSYQGKANSSMLIKGAEKRLAAAVRQSGASAAKAIEREDFEAAMAAIARLREPIDEFFEEVTVNDDDASFRENRLILLSNIRSATQSVADFSRIEG